MRMPVSSPSWNSAIGGVAQARRVEERAGALARERQRLRGAGRRPREHLRHRHVLARSPPWSGPGTARARARPRRASRPRVKSGTVALVLAVVGDERLHRVARSPACCPSGRPSRGGHQPAHDRAGSARPSASARTSEFSTIAVERTFEFQNQSRYGSLSSSTCALPASGRIAFDMRRRRSASARDRRLRSPFAHQRVVQIREREHRHPIAIAVEPRDVRVLVAAALDEHLHRERLPRGVGGPPALVRRRRLRQLAARGSVARGRASPRSTAYFRSDGRLEDVQQVAREVRRRATGTAPGQ